jgi:hypothetical protein
MEMILFTPKSVLSAVALLGVVGLGRSCNKLGKPNDDAITTAIQAKMYSEPLLKASSIAVVTKDGIVTLTGQVPDDAARLAAERISSQTDGVKQVIDSTTMIPPAPAAAMSQNSPEPPLSAPAPRPAPARRDRSKRNRDDERNLAADRDSEAPTNSSRASDGSANSSAVTGNAAQV